MKIRDLLAVESIDLNGKVNGKNETLDAMVALMAKSGKINDVEKYRKGVYALAVLLNIVDLSALSHQCNHCIKGFVLSINFAI